MYAFVLMPDLGPKRGGTASKARSLNIAQKGMIWKDKNINKQVAGLENKVSL
jgi:hypothetical protein